MAASQKDTSSMSEDRLARKTDIQGLVKVSEHLTKAMERKGLSQATLMVGLCQLDILSQISLPKHYCVDF